MKKVLLLSFTALITATGFSQSRDTWSVSDEKPVNIEKDKAVLRVAFPKTFKLFSLNASSLRNQLAPVTGLTMRQQSTVISLPNAEGHLEQFEIVEASNFEPELQARFPEIRAYSGKGITDPYATLKMSLSPQGLQTMVFRTEKPNEFIEPYSKDHTLYAVFSANREKGRLPWTCSTVEQEMALRLNAQVAQTITADAVGSSTGLLKTMRLAQSCNGEYANYFGATSSAQVSLVLSAFNATLTRCNGIYEKDLALHLNLIPNTTSVIYYSPSTDPYSTTLSQWNLQLQQTLTSVIGSANYDIGHMFGASGGGGNAGCIGCVCVNPATSNSLGKGSGITSPADGIPTGDNFDIDYVAHEVGHQLGANHTFSQSLEGTGVNKEVGSGITIMGYAGITSYDVARHSIDIFHQASIAQIQANLTNKTCPVSTNISANNAAPQIGAVSNNTIPISTPFSLTGSATDVNGDALTYCWEQNDNSTTSGSGSVASPPKATGPNWLSFLPTISGTRLFPKLSTILAGLDVTPTQGGDAAANTEALSSVSRTLNFRLTVRDNHAFSSTAPVAVGQTAFTDVVVTVTNTSGPFQVTSPNTNITWSAGGSATVSWSVNGTNAGSVNCQAVNILLSTDGGLTFPTVLASSTANDGSEIVTVPASGGTANRIKVESVGNIFFDISNTNFTIGAAAACASPSGLTASAIGENAATLSWTAVSGAISYDVDYKTVSTGTWTNAATETSATSINLSGLSAGTVYDWRVRVNCAGGTGNFTQAQFTTISGTVTCPGTYDTGNNGSVGVAPTIPLNTEVFGLINIKGDNDYYKFIITSGGTISVTLTSLPADYQLALLSSTGAVIQTSANAGTANETINRTVTAGTYYARIYPRNNGASNTSNCYTLNVQTGTASRNAEVPYVSNRLDVSPNPAGYVVSLAFNADVAGNATVSVLDQAGATLLNRSFAVNEGNNTRKLDIGNLAKGMYFIRIQTGSVIQMAKLVIAK